ncbi:MAG TPA: hypothetical protein VKA48_01110, partial [Gammaproteobacteria bacterium]|nr:hypothetical protein [Gammaproteobacteria bacterium]
NVWVYTEGFAERFGMPEKWVSDKLEGAYAAAFRVETSSARLMFPHKGKDVSKPVRRCVLDLFLPSEANIPWANDKVADTWWYTPEAPTYLMPQREKDKQWQRRPVGIPVAGQESREPMVNLRPEGRSMARSLHLRAYDRKLYPGVTYLSFNMGCTTPTESLSWIELMKDGDWDYNERELSDVGHRVRLPAGFMQRLHEEWRTRSRKPADSEWNKVTE